MSDASDPWFPRTPHEITREWIETRLRAAGALSEGHVRAIEIAPLSDPGYSADVVRIAIAYEGAARGPTSLIAKLASARADMRDAMRTIGSYQREVSFYRDFGADVGIPIPTPYAAEIDTSSNEFVLLLEDLLPSRCGDFWYSNVEDVEVALDHLAAFHARWWNSPELLQVPWLRNPNDADHYKGTLGAVYRALLPKVLVDRSDALVGYLGDIARALAERWETFAMAAPDAPLTLCHGDYHPRQMFFPTAAGGRFAVFDWQSTTIATASVDVQRILLMGLRTPELIANQARLLARYRNALALHGVDYPAAELERAVRKSMLWTVFVLVFAEGTSDPQFIRRQAAVRGVDDRQRFFFDLGECLEYNRVHELF